MFNGLNMGIGGICKLSDAKTFSISPENFTGGKGAGGRASEGTGKNPARDLGMGFKVSPSVVVPPKSVFVMGEITGAGVIQHIWCTCFPDKWRTSIFKIYWDGKKEPSVNCPIGDFFLNGWCERSNVSSLAMTVNPAGGFNSYFPMPFKKGAKIEIENLSDAELVIYYQIDFARAEPGADDAYFHASWNRTSPLGYAKDYVILDTIKGKGHYVGTYLAWQVNNNGWWGEGEVKFFMDGDDAYPTVCGTGTEDYFGGAWNFEYPKGEYGIYSTPYQGLHQVIKPDGLYRANMRFGMYRWHIMDPVRFESSLKVTIQALGWRSGGRYLPLRDDIASVAYWYQSEPAAAARKAFTADDYEVI